MPGLTRGIMLSDHIPEGGRVRIRASWWRASLAALLIVCGYISKSRPANGADPGTAISTPHQSSGVIQPAPAPQVAVVLPDRSPAWFLNRIRRLIHEDRAAEAHQIARAAVALHPDSPELRLGAAFAAMRSGRCTAASGHLDALRDATLAPVQRRRADLVRAVCSGPWRWQALIGASAGYRPSLVDRQRDVEIRLQPGSRLHGLCVRLESLCDPDRPLVSHGQRDSGVDLWLDLTIRHLYRAGGRWDFDLDAILFQRRPGRPGYAGDGSILRVGAYRHGAGREIRIGAETGRARFAQGRPDRAIAQRHRRVHVGLSVAHMSNLQSDIELSHLAVRSQWLNLARRRYQYRLARHLRRSLTVSLFGAREISRQDGAGMMPGSRAGETGADLRWTGDHIEAHLHHALRHETFRGRMPFLAAPHRARTHTTRLDVMTGDRPEWLNLKVVLSFQYRKISTADPFRRPSSKTLLLRLSREVFASH